MDAMSGGECRIGIQDLVAICKEAAEAEGLGMANERDLVVRYLREQAAEDPELKASWKAAAEEIAALDHHKRFSQ